MSEIIVESNINSIEEKDNDISGEKMSFSSAIQDIIEGNKKPENYGENFDLINKVMRVYFRKGFNSIENKEDYSFFNKINRDIDKGKKITFSESKPDEYSESNLKGANENFYKKNVETSFNKKFSKFFPIHYSILLDNMKFLGIKDKGEINIFLKKYSHIIFIYGEKIKLSELDKLLKEDATKIGNLLEKVEGKITDIHKKERENIKEIKAESCDTDHALNCEFLNRNFLDSVFRNTLKKVSLGEKVLNEESLFSETTIEIENLYKIEIENLYNVFEKWLDSDGLLEDNLLNLENVSLKILHSIDIFKDTNIAFTETILHKSNENGFIDEILEKLFNKEKYLNNGMQKNTEIVEKFSKFLKIVFQNGGKEKYDIFIDYIKEYKKNLSRSRLPDELYEVSNVDLNETCFDEWDRMPEKQKYKHMFNEVIAKDGKAFISEYINIDNIDETDLRLFCDSYLVDKKEDDYGLDYEIVKEQFQEIEQLIKEGISLENFIQIDINNLNLLVIWWRFIQKTRKLKKEGREINIEEIKSIIERPYGVIEKISKKLNEKGILDINFKPDGRLTNTSVETTGEQLHSILNGFEKGPIDSLKTQITNTNNQKIDIVDMVDLYIPADISDNGNGLTTNQEISSINNWMNHGIDLCYKLLQRKKNFTAGELKYLEALKEYNLLPDNIENLNLHNLDKIQDLVESLKLIKNRRKKLAEMMIIAENDKKNIEGELGGLLKDEENSKMNSDFGPKKSFIRAFKKLIKNHSGDFTALGDLTRLRVVRKDIDSMVDSVVEFVDIANKSENIKHISIVDYTGEPISDPSKESGYRDIKVLFTLTTGNVVELQFQYEEMLIAKEKGVNLEEDKNNFIFDKMKKEKKGLTENDLLELFKIAKKKNLKLPKKKILEKLLISGNITSLINTSGIDTSLLCNNMISTDYLYDISRELDKPSKNSIKKEKETKEYSLYTKLKRLERTIADNAWAKIVIDYLKGKGIKMNDNEEIEKEENL